MNLSVRFQENMAHHGTVRKSQISGGHELEKPVWVELFEGLDCGERCASPEDQEVNQSIRLVVTSDSSD